MTTPRITSELIRDERGWIVRAVHFVDGREIDLNRVIVMKNGLERVSLGYALACLSGNTDYQSFLMTGKGASPHAYYELDKRIR